VRAQDLLHPEFAPGLPGFVVSFDYRLPAGSPAEQLRALAADRTVRGRLLYGIALQGIGRPVSARRAFSAAAEQAPNDVDALVADAVGRYDKGNPSAAFSRLGPLSRRSPNAATVRFHLGLLLLWQKDVQEATRQLELARTAEPGSKIAAEATRFLDAVRNAGTS
jgi:predicted Zn-dependent protease